MCLFILAKPFNSVEEVLIFCFVLWPDSSTELHQFERTFLLALGMNDVILSDTSSMLVEEHHR